jgi:hypothetical protein
MDKQGRVHVKAEITDGITADLSATLDIILGYRCWSKCVLWIKQKCRRYLKLVIASFK